MEKIEVILELELIGDMALINDITDSIKNELVGQIWIQSDDSNELNAEIKNLTFKK